MSSHWKFKGWILKTNRYLCTHLQMFNILYPITARVSDGGGVYVHRVNRSPQQWMPNYFGARHDVPALRKSQHSKFEFSDLRVPLQHFSTLILSQRIFCSNVEAWKSLHDGMNGVVMCMPMMPDKDLCSPWITYLQWPQLWWTSNKYLC